MNLQKELQSCSVVILAQNFNPSIFNRHWLVKNKFIDDHEITDDSVFALGVSNIITPQFSLLVTPDHLHFEINGASLNYCECLHRVLIKIINRLPEIPYKAVGLNFEWHIFDDDSSPATISRALFYPVNPSLQAFFNTDDSLYGCYLSKNFHDSRMKLDINPTVVCKPNLEEKEVFRFSFNYHRELNEQTGFDDLKKNLQDCNIYFDASVKIVDAL